jgi:hypothetical protein
MLWLGILLAAAGSGMAARQLQPILTPPPGRALRCYSDHAGPNSAGGIETCDEGGVCSSSRIVFREEGVLRTAMSRHCVSRTPDRAFGGGSEWPWCHEEWAGGDEGGMEVFTCYCQVSQAGCMRVSDLLPLGRAVQREHLPVGQVQ